MRRILPVGLILVPAFVALFILVADAAHDVDTTKTLASSTRADLFKLIRSALVEEARVFVVSTS